MKKILVHITLLFLLSFSGLAQAPRFYLGLDGIMDNREYSTPDVKHQTIFGVRINPGVAFTFDSLHSVHLGINYMYEFGGEFLGVTPQLDIYYKYSSEQIDFHFGSPINFPSLPGGIRFEGWNANHWQKTWWEASYRAASAGVKS